MRKNSIKLLLMWLIVILHFVLMLLLKEPLSTYFFLFLAGAMLTSLLVLKEKAALSADFRKASGFAFDVGFYSLTIWLFQSFFTLVFQ